MLGTQMLGLSIPCILFNGKSVNKRCETCSHCHLVRQFNTLSYVILAVPLLSLYTICCQSDCQPCAEAING